MRKFLIPIVIVIIASYLLGSIPFSYMAGRLRQGIDLREHGSGNLGASNTFRILGPRIAFTVLAADVIKGFLPVHFAYLANRLSAGSSLVDVNWLMLIAALMAVLGHMFSVYLKFSGGKGIATSAGAFIALSPWAFLGAFLIWLITFITTRIVSIASLLAAISLPGFVILAARFFDSETPWSVFSLSIVIAVVVVGKHRSNIRRLIEGKEPVLARKKR